MHITRYWLMPATAVGIYAFFFAQALTLGDTRPASVRVDPAAAATPAGLFADGASSPEELVDRLLTALAANDEASVQRLRVTRDEYLEIIVPGTVEPGQPLRQVSEQPREFFWRYLDQKNRDFGDILLQRYGGHPYLRQEIRFTAATTSYATYQALGRTHILVRDADGAEGTIRTGYIAAVGGRYKFIGFEWDD